MKGDWTRAAVALGSNLGVREEHLARAVEEIAALPDVRAVRASEWIETEPQDCPEGSPPFLNGAVLLETRLPVRRLLAELQRIERAHGRVRRGGRGEPRPLDLDLLLFGDERVDDPDLVVPHPRLEERVFVLRPLARLDPGLRLPSGVTVAARIAALPR